MRELMVQVERAVRPVRASARRKDRMREELLAHLSSIYEEELKRCREEGLARKAAFERLGNLRELTCALQEAVSLPERVDWRIERWLGWQAPETAARYTFRLALILFVISMALSGLVVAATFFMQGTGVDAGTRLRLGFAFVMVTCADVFFLGLLYFKIRDALFGAPWARQSWFRALAYGVLFGFVVLISGLAVPLIGTAALAPTSALWPNWYFVSLAAPVLPILIALSRGRAEIRHTLWACLDIAD